MLQQEIVQKQHSDINRSLKIEDKSSDFLTGNKNEKT